MKLAPKIFAASLLAATSFCLAGAVHAVPLGMGLSLKDAVTPAAEAVQPTLLSPCRSRTAGDGLPR